MKFEFEKLIIWQKAMEFGEEINIISEDFPKKELYNLVSQIKRASDSIAISISEGAIEPNSSEFKRFVEHAIRSIAEVVTCLYKAKNRMYITNEKFNELYEYSFNLMNMMIAFKNDLK